MDGSPTPDRDRVVPLGELVRLARLGREMRAAQRAYFDRRKQQPHLTHAAEWRAARDAERRFDSAVRDAESRERVSLPGLEAGESG